MLDFIITTRRDFFSLIFKHIFDLYCVSREKKKAESASSTTPAQVETRVDKDKVETRLDKDKVETRLDKDKVETRLDEDKVETRLDEDKVETRLDEDKVETRLDNGKVETRLDKDKVETRLDKDKAERRREAAKPAMQKRRANQHPNKKRAVRDKRMSCSYREKRQKGIICYRPGGRRQFKLKCYFSPRTVLILPKGHSSVLGLSLSYPRGILQSSDCPYPTQGAFQRAVRRVKGEIHAEGKRFAFLFKGLLKSSDEQTKRELSQLHVQYSSFYSNQKASG